MPNDPWHLSKSIPITLIFAIVCQTVALIWFVATLRNDVDANSADILRLDTRTSSLETVVQSQAITLARIDENLKAIREILDRQESDR